MAESEWEQPASRQGPRDTLFDLTGRRILLAGAAGGLGSPLARELSRRGASLMLADLHGEQAAALAGELAAGGPAHSCGLDVTDEASCGAAVDETVRCLGGLDVLVNASGAYRTAPALDLTLRDWNLTIGSNLTGAFLLARAAGRHMVSQRAGRIVTFASVSSTVANPNYAAYAASKAGVAHLTRVLAREWAPFGVTVNAIGPAVTPTPMSEPILGDDKHRADALSVIPMGRFGTPDDLVGGVVFLSSAAGAFVTGQTLYVDGGRSIV